MDISSVISAIEKWDKSNEGNRLKRLLSIRENFPDELLPFFDAFADTKMSGISDNSEARVLILLHGIQTEAKWQQELRQEFSDLSNLNTIPLGYGFKSPIQLLSPHRSGPVNEILQKIRSIKSKEPNAKVSIIAHSFGTYIVSRILTEHPDIQFERVILCGCIIDKRFRWDKHAITMRSNSIINDVGARDIWPVFATITTLGYGSSGRIGFQTPEVKDRYFDYAHSDFFNPTLKHASNYWKPFISDGVIVESSWEANRPNTPFFLLMLTNPYIGRTLVGLLAALLIFAVWWLITCI